MIVLDKMKNIATTSGVSATYKWTVINYNTLRLLVVQW